MGGGHHPPCGAFSWTGSSRLCLSLCWCPALGQGQKSPFHVHSLCLSFGRVSSCHWSTRAHGKSPQTPTHRTNSRESQAPAARSQECCGCWWLPHCQAWSLPRDRDGCHQLLPPACIPSVTLSPLAQASPAAATSAAQQSAAAALC